MTTNNDPVGAILIIAAAAFLIGFMFGRLYEVWKQ